MRDSLFWDTGIDKIDIKKHAKYIIRRIVDYGDETDIKWLKKTFNKSAIRAVIKNSKGISRKTAHFWACYYNLPEKEIECLKPYYPKELSPF